MLTSALAFSLSASAGVSRVLYVDAALGKDSDPGVSPRRALKTIGRAARVLRGGDMLVVGPGLYMEEVTFSNLGSSREKPVWILARPRGKATISGVWKDAALGRAAT